MADVRWIGRARATAQVDSITAGGTIGTETFTLTVGDATNGRQVTYTAESGDTADDVAAGLVAAWNDDDNPEIGEITASDQTATTTGMLYLTADESGKPFDVAATASGSATLTRAAVTANSSPNDAGDAKNYSGGSLPSNTDNLIFEDGDVDVLWNLDALAAVTLTNLHRKASYTGRIGLEDEDPNGYPQYRDTHLEVGATNIFDEQGDAPQALQTRLNVGSVQTTYRGTATGGGQLGSEATELLGTHASNIARVLGGSLAVAPKVADATTIATLQADNGTVRVGPGCTITTVELSDSEAQLESSCTTLNQRDNSLSTVYGTSAITNSNIIGGTLDWRSSGSPGTVEVFADAVVRYDNAPDGISVTKTILHRGASLLDPGARISRSHEIECPDCDLDEVTIEVGRDFQITVADVS